MSDRIVLSGKFTKYGVDHEYDTRKADEDYEGVGDVDE